MEGSGKPEQEIHTDQGHPLRFVTAAGLFDGHDAAINIMRRILVAEGAEVIHLGHNRSVDEVVTAAIQEDVQGIAVSSYQGGHLEYFRYMIDLLRDRGRPDIRVFGGGGGVIVADEQRALHDYGVTRIYTPEDGQTMGLKGMIQHMMRAARFDPAQQLPARMESVAEPGFAPLARILSALEADGLTADAQHALTALAEERGPIPVLGITGTGGAGKSSLTDELILRFRLHTDEPRIAVLAIDPSRLKSGGALLGDRIRMNAIAAPNLFFRSLATRGTGSHLPPSLPQMVEACKAAGFDLVIVETPGIGQGDAAITQVTNLSLYVMTPEFGAASQLEKIAMLDFADLVAINKFDRRGARDALRDVRKQYQRNHERFDRPAEAMPVFGTMAARFNDPGVTALAQAVGQTLADKGFSRWRSDAPPQMGADDETPAGIVPAQRVRYLSEIADTVRGYHRRVDEQSRLARECQQLQAAQNMAGDSDALASALRERQNRQDRESARLLEDWPRRKADYQGTSLDQGGRSVALTHETLSGNRIPRVAVPPYEDHGELLRWMMRENLPGAFPFTGGVFPFKRQDEDPTRMFAGEGDPFRTNRRFKLLSKDQPAKRLSTAFDSVTLYGQDPDPRPDIYGKVGNSGVSIATLDDMKALYDGFDLCDPMTSVSMTINGPAPILLAMFFNTALDQQVAAFAAEHGRPPDDTETAALLDHVHRTVRGTVQADILKEDQGQNTCIFSTEFALRMMADIQDYFVRHSVRNFYSVSISGYHIAEAGANPISQLAFTLANGFTYVESYLARGMDIDDFAPNLSFFFSNGMEAEYAVMGRVARRIWAVAMRDRYGAKERSQKLKYHTQTSGRSLHAQEMAFNDIRTTLQALIATYDNTNSLHTNAYDEAVTTPTDQSVRRAMAIQMILNREWGLAKNENPNQGSFIIEQLTDLVEEAVLAEFDRISERGGVLGAMETGYQRGKIQDESLYYEHRKDDGSYPIIGVNTFLDPAADDHQPGPPQLARSTENEKQSQLARLSGFHQRHADRTPALLDQVKQAATSGGNIFDALMAAVRGCSLGQISQALFEVGGRYRRNM